MDRWQLAQMKQQGLGQLITMMRQAKREDYAQELQAMNAAIAGEKFAFDKEMKTKDDERAAEESRRKGEVHGYTMDTLNPLKEKEIGSRITKNTAQTGSANRGSAGSFVLGEIYDEETGQSRKVLFNNKTGESRPIGGLGTKSGGGTSLGDISAAVKLGGESQRRIGSTPQQQMFNPDLVPTYYDSLAVQETDRFLGERENRKNQAAQAKEDTGMRQALRKQFPGAKPGETKREPTTGIWWQFDGKDWQKMTPKKR